MRRLRRIVAGSVATIALVITLAVAVFPTRTYLAQRRQLTRAEERVQLLDEQNRILAARVKKLHTDEEIERLAREQYSLVRPGEEAYALLPTAEDAAEAAAEAAEPERLPPVERDRSLWSRVKDAVTFWD